MIKFINETAPFHEEFTATRRIEFEVADEASLDEMLDTFRSFLLASGYAVQNELVVEHDDE